MRIFVTVIVLVLFPAVTFAASCSPSGMTVVYVNGILTTYPEAKRDLGMLQTEYIDRTRDYSTNFLTGYNQTHLAGGTDIIQSAAQAFGKSVSDFDLNTILMQIQPQVSTRKILLVGHSQGTFYTNAIYKYLTENGVPAESIAVYNLATPADHIAGGGKYLTSTNDKLINGIRPLMAKYGANMPFAANITIPIPANELNDPAGGHHFGSSYLAMEPERIVSDITSALGKLKAGAPSSPDGCFTPPPTTLAYKTQAVVFAVADPVAQRAKNSATAAGSALAAAAQKAQAAAAYAASKIKSAFSYLFKTQPRASATSQGSAAALTLAPPPATNPPAKTAASTPAPSKAPLPTVSAPKTENTAPAATVVKTPDPPLPPAPPPTSQTIQQQILPHTLGLGPALMSVVPGFGGGGAPPAPSPAEATAAPVPSISVPLYVQASLEGALFATSSITLSGTTTPEHSVIASYSDQTATAAADSAGDWSITITLTEGATAIGIVATDSAGNTSDAVTRTIAVDTMPPDAPAASIAECAASLSTSFCLIPATAAALSWPEVSGASYYAYALYGTIIATTTGTGAALSLSASASTTISVAAYDAGGNAATSTIDAYVLANPLVINEIAWAGTLVSSSDKWIELKNNSPYSLNNLSSLAVVSADGSPYIQLSGSLSYGGHYLIEHREEATSVAGDLVLSLDALSTNGEELRLLWGSGSATTTIDATPAQSACSGWCSGISVPTAMTMERKPSEDGAAEESWQFGINTAASTATDASGLTISGTPRAENSEGGEPPILLSWM